MRRSVSRGYTQRVSRLALAAAIVLLAPRAAADDDVSAAARCLRLVEQPSAAVAAVHARWLPPRPLALTVAGAAVLGPEGNAHPSLMARLEVSRWAPLHTTLQLRGLLGVRPSVMLDALVGLDLRTRREARFRGRPSPGAPWDEDPPSDPAAAESWLRERTPGCGLAQGAWRALVGLRALLPVEADTPGPPTQFAAVLGLGWQAETWRDDARSGIDLVLGAMLDPIRVRPGVLGRMSLLWRALSLGLEGGWIPGPEGYGLIALDVGLRISR